MYVPYFIADFQTLIGYNDIKSSPVYFYVQRNSSFSITNTPIPFVLSRLNIGGAMDLASGIFTAPRTGTYFFVFNGLGQFPSSSNIVVLDVAFYLNGNVIGMGDADDASKNVQDETFTFQLTLSLQAGDQTWLEITRMDTGTYLNDDFNHHTHYSGWLLEEKISDSLKA